MSQLSTFAPTIKPGSGPVFTLTGNTGGPVMPDGVGNINTVVGSSNGSPTITGVNATHTLSLTFTDVDDNTVIGTTAFETTRTVGVAVATTGLGFDVLNAVTTGTANTAVGYLAGQDITTGSENAIYGWNAGNALTTGANNTLLGESAGIAYTTESFNINIGHNGVIADSGMIRIGSGGIQTGCYIAGIDGVNVGSVATVVTEDNNILGTAVITAGANITVTPGANTITIAANSSSQVVNYVTVLHAASPYTVLSTDYYISADVTGGIIIVKLPDAPATGRIFVVKDKVGLAATSNITVTTVSGGDTIDGVTTFIMNTNYESANFIFNGSNYEVF